MPTEVMVPPPLSFHSIVRAATSPLARLERTRAYTVNVSPGVAAKSQKDIAIPVPVAVFASDRAPWYACAVDDW
jgi:hypothetical protein